MKKCLALLSTAMFVLVFTASAQAHCGSCGVGGEKKLEKTCTQKCTKAKDAKACVLKCQETHKKNHGKK